MKIIALLPVKNEEWCLESCLKSLSFVDKIIAIDDNSTDSTKDILKKYNCKIIDLATSADIGWREYEIRSKLLEEARNEGATHIISLDADEAFSDQFQEQGRAILSKLEIGQSLEMEWLNLCSKTTYKAPIIFKTFAFRDDKKSKFKKGFLGIPRVPINNIKTFKIKENFCVFHYQYINKDRCNYKQVWYMVSEFLKKEMTAKKINNIYSHTKNFVCKNIIELEKIPNEIPKIDNSNIWQREKILLKFNQYGIKFFESLDIWYIEELKKLFVKEIGREPKPEKFPNWLIELNNIKNFIKNKI